MYICDTDPRIPRNETTSFKITYYYSSALQQAYDDLNFEV